MSIRPAIQVCCCTTAYVLSQLLLRLESDYLPINSTLLVHIVCTNFRNKCFVIVDEMVIKLALTIGNSRARRTSMRRVSVEFIVHSIFSISQPCGYSLVWEFPNVTVHLIVILTTTMKY